MQDRTYQFIEWITVFFACLLTNWPVPVSKAQPFNVFAPAQLTVKDSIQILESQVEVGKRELEELIPATNKTLDKIPVPVRRVMAQQRPKFVSETVYFRSGGEVFEKQIVKEDGLLVVDLDSLCNQNHPSDEVQPGESGSCDPGIIPEDKPSWFKKQLQKVKSIFKRNKK